MRPVAPEAGLASDEHPASHESAMRDSTQDLPCQAFGTLTTRARPDAGIRLSSRPVSSPRNLNIYMKFLIDKLSTRIKLVQND